MLTYLTAITITALLLHRLYLFILNLIICRWNRELNFCDSCVSMETYCSLSAVRILLEKLFIHIVPKGISPYLSNSFLLVCMVIRILRAKILRSFGFGERISFSYRQGRIFAPFTPNCCYHKPFHFSVLVKSPLPLFAAKPLENLLTQSVLVISS